MPHSVNVSSYQNVININRLFCNRNIRSRFWIFFTFSLTIKLTKFDEFIEKISFEKRTHLLSAFSPRNALTVFCQTKRTNMIEFHFSGILSFCSFDESKMNLFILFLFLHLFQLSFLFSFVSILFFCFFSFSVLWYRKFRS